MGRKASEGQEDPTFDIPSIEKSVFGLTLGRFKNLWGEWETTRKMARKCSEIFLLCNESGAPRKLSLLILLSGCWVRNGAQESASCFWGQCCSWVNSPEGLWGYPGRKSHQQIRVRKEKSEGQKLIASLPLDPVDPNMGGAQTQGRDTTTPTWAGDSTDIPWSTPATGQSRGAAGLGFPPQGPISPSLEALGRSRLAQGYKLNYFLSGTINYEAQEWLPGGEKG